MHTSPVILISLIIALSIFFLLSVVIGQKRQSRVKYAFIHFVGCTFLVAFFEFLFRLPLGRDYQELLVNASLLSFYFLGCLYLRFIYVVIDRPSDIYLKIFFFLAMAGALCTIVMREYTIVFDEIWHYPVVAPTPTQALLLLFTAISPGVYAIALNIKHMRKPEHERQRRIVGLLVTGAAISVVISIFVLFVTPIWIPDKIIVYQFSSLSLLIHNGYMYWAVTKYHFLSVNYEEIEEVSRGLFEHVTDAIVIIGASGEVVQANGPARALLGPQMTVAQIEAGVKNYYFDENYNNFRTEVMNNGTECAVLLSQTRIAKADVDLGKLLILRDVTKQVKLESDRARMEERIHQAEKLEAIGQLAGGVAHDFNNQLAGITGFAELIRSESSSQSQLRRWADNILLTTRRGADLTSQLLAFARKGKYLSMSIDVHKTINEVVSLLHHSIDKQIDLVTRFAADQSVTRGDPSQIQNAILNLGLNARDAMPNGGRITFTTENVQLNRGDLRDSNFDIELGAYILITVADTGIGMDSETIQRIFEPFFTTKAAGKGTGMGLAAVYGTAKNHAGTIKVASSPNRGSRFRLYLPVSSSQPRSIEPAENQMDAIKGEGKILLVDDEHLIRESTTAILEDLGYSVMTAVDGHQALELFRKHCRELDLVILDLVMPGLTGKQVFDQLLRIKPGMRILLSSGYSIDERAQEIISAGAAGFLQKPFRMRTIAKVVANILNGRSSSLDVPT